jgi:Zn-dependent protease with chaperone function
LVPSLELNAYVNTVLQRLIVNSPVASLPAQAFVLASNDFNASCGADGSVLVTVGLLRNIESEDELAAVLAHEISHFIYRHHAADWFTNSQKHIAAATGFGDQLKSMVKGTGYEESGLSLALAVGAELSERVIAPNLWNKDQEREADLLGIDLLVAAKYNPDTALEMLGRVAINEEIRRKRAEEERQRAKSQLDEEVRKQQATGNIGGVVTTILGGISSAAGQAVDSAIDAVSSDHEPAEERIKHVRDYIAKHHRYAERPDPGLLPWKQSGDPTKVVMDNYDSARRSDVALGEGKSQDALILAKRSVRGATEYDAYPRVVFSSLRKNQGDLKNAYLNLQLATRSRQPALVIYQKMIHYKFERGQLAEIPDLVAAAREKMGNPPHLLPYSIGVLVMANKKSEAFGLLSECKLNYPDLAALCDKAYQGLDEMMAGDSEGDERRATRRLTDKAVSKPVNAFSGADGN